MCLAVPGRIIEVQPAAEGAAGPTGLVDFQGSRLEIGLAFVPEAGPGDWVLVHAGFALNVLDEKEAIETWRYLKELDLVGPRPGDPTGPDPAPPPAEPR